MKLLSTLQIHDGRVVPVCGTPGGSSDPISTVCALMERGCSKLCLLDVNAAHGVGQNREEILRLIRLIRQSNPRACIQVGGGIRSSDQAQLYLDAGATWLLVGTILHRSPLVMEQLLARFREQLTAAIDVREGQLQASGWTESMGTTPEAVARLARELGFRRLLLSDIPGACPKEPDFTTATRLYEQSHLPVMMGGTLQTPAHIASAARTPGICGILVDAHIMINTPELLETHQLCV